MKAIGGYFSLELPLCEEYHKGAIKLNTGRNCLEYILRARNFSKVYIPYYTCAAVLEPFQKLGIPYVFYHIDFNFEINDDIQPKVDEAILYTNHFGLKSQYVEKLANVYGNRIIIDNTQAFYAKPIKGIDTFYSCRKFFGVPDGAYLFPSMMLDKEIEQDISYQRMNHLLKRIDLSAEEGFADFHRNDDSLGRQPIRRMSKLTERLMQSIDYACVRNIRINNYLYLHSRLATNNLLKLELEVGSVPMVYPFFYENDEMRIKLINNKVFVARYWPNVLEWADKGSVEYKLAQNILPLPIDQRYSAEDMEIIMNFL